MTWSAFTLFLARRTEFAFNIGHVWIILLDHSLLTTFQVSISLIFDIFRSHCFGWNRSKVVWGSKLMNTFMHGPSFFSFHFSFSISFSKLTIFTILRLYVAWKMWKITALTWEISSWRLVEKFHISALPMTCIILYIIGLESMKVQNYKKNNFFESRKKDTKTTTKRHEWNEMTQNGLFHIFSNMHAWTRSICTSSYLNVACEKQQEISNGPQPWNECSCKSACAIFKYAQH